MAWYGFEFNGYIDIEAESEDDAWEKFRKSLIKDSEYHIMNIVTDPEVKITIPLD